MTGLNGNLARRLRARIREFEDRKITGADLSREIYLVAREIESESESVLRRKLEQLGNQVAAVVEQDFVTHSPKILKVVDQLESELVEWGY